MSIIRILTVKWAQLLVALGVLTIASGALWLTISGIFMESAPLAPFLLLALGMMPFLVGIEELSNRRKTQRLQFHKR